MHMLRAVAVLVVVGFLATGAPSHRMAVAAAETGVRTPDRAGDDGGQKKAVDEDHSTRDKWAKPSPPPSDADKSKPKYKPWNEVLKDADKHEGLFNVYTKQEDVFFEIKTDQLDRPLANFMNISQGIGTGWVLGGMPLGILETVMFDFHRVEDHIQVRRLNPRFQAGDDEALANSVDLTFGNSILASLPIASENEKENSVLVKVNEFFLSDVSDVGEWLQGGLQTPVILDPSKAVFGRVKAFPENVEVEAMLTFSPASRLHLSLPQVPDERFIEVGVNSSIRMLPEEPMKPRIADDRTGFYMSPHKDFSRDASESFLVHYINRWRLEKKNPGASLSEPKKPITYYMDPTIPEHYVKYVKRGVEMWQRAFEEAGFENAIVAVDPGDDPDYDAEDARYNTIRWIVSDEPSFGAIGPHRTDPRTGEILESDILMEQSMIAGFRKVYRRYAGPDAVLSYDPMLMFLKDPAVNEDAARFMELWSRTGFGCNMSYGFSTGFALGQLALLVNGSGMETPEEYVGEAIAEVTAHEVGHGLGLRHNFKSSTAVPYEKLNDKRYIEQSGMTGSVMDYANAHVSRDRSKQGYYFTPTVGTYDRWVIKWGYTEFEGDMTPQDELRKLREIAEQASDKRNTYGTDEDTYPAGALDPDCMIWDLSDQPLAWAEERIGVCKDVLSSDHLIDRVVREGDSYVPLRSAVVTVFIQEYIAGSRAVRYIGGQKTARPHRGDNTNQTPLMPVSGPEQRAAMDFLAMYVFGKDAFTVSPNTLSLLQDDKMRDWQNNVWQPGRRFDFPLSGWVAALQNATMFQLLNPARLQRMVDAQYTTDNAYRLSEMFATLSRTIWLDNAIATGRSEVMQRNLQRIYLNYLVEMIVEPGPPAMGVPPEAVALARLNLERIRDGIDGAYKQPNLSDEANAHLVESRDRIARALKAEMISSH